MKHFARIALVGAFFASFLLIGSVPALADCHENGALDCPIDPPQSVEVDPNSIESEGLTTSVEDPSSLEAVESDLPGDSPTFIDPVPLAPRTDPPPDFTQLDIPMRWQQAADVSSAVQALGMAMEGLGEGAPSSPAILAFLQTQDTTSDFGSAAEQLAFTAQKFGYLGSIPFNNWDLAQLQAELDEGRAPVIALGANAPSDFVTITGISPDGEWVSYNDPVLGKQVLKIEEFMRLWGLQGYRGVAVRKTEPVGEFDPIPWVAFVAGLMALFSLTPLALKRMGIGGGLRTIRDRSRPRTFSKGKSQGLRERVADRLPDGIVLPKRGKSALKATIEAREYAFEQRSLLDKGKELSTKIQLSISKLLKPKTLAERISDRLLSPAAGIAAPPVERRWYAKLPSLKTPVKIAIAGSTIVASGLVMKACGANFDSPCPIVGPGILLSSECSQGEGVFSVEISPQATIVLGEFTPDATGWLGATPVDVFLTPGWEPETPQPGPSTPQPTVQFEQPMPGVTSVHAQEGTAPSEEDESVQIDETEVPDPEYWFDHPGEYEERVREETKGAQELIEGREIDSVTDELLIQAKANRSASENPDNFLSQSRRRQIKATIELAQSSGKDAQFWFPKDPHPEVREYIETRGGQVIVWPP